MNEAAEDLGGTYQVQRSQVINHPAYANPVLMTQYGFAKRGQEVWWYETKFEEISSKDKPWVKSYCGGKPNYTTTKEEFNDEKTK